MISMMLNFLQTNWLPLPVVSACCENLWKHFMTCTFAFYIQKKKWWIVKMEEIIQLQSTLSLLPINFNALNCTLEGYSFNLALRVIWEPFINCSHNKILHDPTSSCPHSKFSWFPCIETFNFNDIKGEIWIL